MDRSIQRIKIWQNSFLLLFSPLCCLSFHSIHFYSVSLNVSGIWAGIWSNGSTQMLLHPFSPYWNCEYTHDCRWEPSSTLQSIISMSDLLLNFRREHKIAKRPQKTENSELQKTILAETHPFRLCWFQGPDWKPAEFSACRRFRRSHPSQTQRQRRIIWRLQPRSFSPYEVIHTHFSN